MSNETPETTATTKQDIHPALIKPVPLPQPVNLPANFETEIAKLIPMAGTVDLTKEQKAILYAPVDESLVEIRPDGLIYLPWMEYAKRLRDALGGRWALIPKGDPQMKGDLVVWPHYLVIDGKPMGQAYGEQKYSANNAKMTWGDAIEGAKSNALMRLCKGLGMTLDMWQPTFIKAWIAKHAESYPDQDDTGRAKLDRDGKPKLLWRKKANPNSPAPLKKAKPTPPPPPPPPPSPSAPPDDFLEGEELGDEKAEKASKKVFVTLTLTDGKPRNMELSKAYGYFAKMKAQLMPEIYYGILGRFGYEHANQIRPFDKMAKVYEEMVSNYMGMGYGRGDEK